MKLKYRKQFFRAISLLLIIALLCPISLNTVAISANAVENVAGEKTAIKEDVITETVSLGDTLEVPGFVSQAQIEEHGHISRLSDEETLNTLVYLNRDGTKTKYIMDYPVKYIDENGNTKFVDLSLGETTTSFETTANDIVLSVSKDYTKGITLTYKDYLVSLVAVPNNNRTGSGSISTAPITVATRNNNVITYNDVFDTDIDVRYSPLHNGVKEDIVLETYTGINTFDFVLHTGGLGVYSENGDYYIAASEDAEMRMEIGKTIAYDAARRFSVGTLTVTPIKENQMYQLTITVDETFLADANTVYPVLIDPSITVSDTTHGAGAVTDSPVYSGMPTFNMGTALYNPIGYLDSTYQIGRTAVKLTGLINDSTYQNLLISEIQSVNFYIKDSSGTPAKAINLYALTSNSTWTENSLTWNTVGTISPTLQASANVGGGAWSSFDITYLVKGWKAGTYTASCGFILQSSNESVTGNFFSSESAESNWPYLVLTYGPAPGTGGGSSFNTAKQIYLDESTALTTGQQNEKRYYKFIAPVSGEYVFYSSSASGNPYIWLYNSSQTLIAYDDNTGGNNNFRLVASLTQGCTYYIAAGHSGTVTGGYTLNLLISATIPTDVYHLRNEGTSQYVDIHGPVAQVLVHQWTYSAGAQSRWKITKQSDGYYTIQSEYGNKYYIGITSTSTGSDNIELFSSVSDSTRWKIYAKSSGEIFLEPKLAPGKVLYAPNHSVGTELRLTYLSSNLENRNKWKIEFQSNTTLEGQRWSNWCWATSARMFENHYQEVPDARTQNAAVIAIKGAEFNDGGSMLEAEMAANFYASGNQFTNTKTLDNSWREVFSQNTLIDILDTGNVIYITRGWYNLENNRNSGHAYAIIGYSTIFNNGSINYRFYIYDPWPAQEPSDWDAPVITSGQSYFCSYTWLRNGRNRYADDPASDIGIWESFIAVSSSLTANTIAPQFN